jgi:hypothetical protein
MVKAKSQVIENKKLRLTCISGEVETGKDVKNEGWTDYMHENRREL